MFDRVEVRVEAGDGGDGAVSFRREKFVPFGGPDGGDGGSGGDVILTADASETGLMTFKRKRNYKAADGGNGEGRKKHGKRGEDLVLSVPVGTIIWDKTQTGEGVLIADLEQSGQQAVVARGGEGGKGNIHFASSTNKTPRIAQKGEAGEAKSIMLELRLISDVGIIGYPNVGKSSLLAAASAAKPKIADYPFTTLEPILGVVEVEKQSFVLGEIPGLIEGAHHGRGLGHDFLRHAMRTKILIHLIDGTSASPPEDMTQVNEELRLFDTSLARKPQLVVVNKIDLPQVKARLADIKDAFSNAGTAVLFISAATGEGVAELMAEVMKMLTQTVPEMKSGVKAPQKVFRPQPRRSRVTARREGDIIVVVASEVERIVTRVDMTNPEVRWQLHQYLVRHGVSKALAKVGIKPGEKVRCGNIEWEW
ncbi:MAG: GTPase ObgE [Dehalococcoidales bacterium]|nr:GTPase ObgE [Dehalococcoidales bacterium]